MVREGEEQKTVSAYIVDETCIPNMRDVVDCGVNDNKKNKEQQKNGFLAKILLYNLFYFILS